MTFLHRASVLVIFIIEKLSICCCCCCCWHDDSRMLFYYYYIFYFVASERLLGIVTLSRIGKIIKYKSRKMCSDVKEGNYVGQTISINWVNVDVIANVCFSLLYLLDTHKHTVDWCSWKSGHFSDENSSVFVPKVFIVWINV